MQRQDEAARVELERTIQNARERLARLEAEKISLERWLSQDPVALASERSAPGVAAGRLWSVSRSFKNERPLSEAPRPRLGRPGAFLCRGFFE